MLRFAIGNERRLAVARAILAGRRIAAMRE